MRGCTLHRTREVLFNCTGSRRLMSGSTVRHRPVYLRTPHNHNMTEHFLSLATRYSNVPDLKTWKQEQNCASKLDHAFTPNVGITESTPLLLLFTGRLSWTWPVCLSSCKTTVSFRRPSQPLLSLSTRLNGRHPLCLVGLWHTMLRLSTGYPF